MEKTGGFIDGEDALRRVQTRLSFLQTVLGGSIYDGDACERLVLNEDEMAGVFWFFQDIERDLSLVEKVLDRALKKERESLPDFPKSRTAQGGA